MLGRFEGFPRSSGSSRIPPEEHRLSAIKRFLNALRINNSTPLINQIYLFPFSLGPEKPGKLLRLCRIEAREDAAHCAEQDREHDHTKVQHISHRLPYTHHGHHQKCATQGRRAVEV